jgi:hypothetical protein
VVSEFGEAQLDRLRTDGYFFPVDVLSEQEAASILDEVRRYELISERVGGFLRQRWNYPKIHLVAMWADRLVHHPAVLDLASRVIGPDLLVWSTNLFIRPAGSGAELAWHQDAPYFGWRDFLGRTVRIWIALTPATAENGTMRYSRGSHTCGLLRHGYRGDGASGVLRGEEVQVEVDEATAVDVLLRAGQCSLHQPTTVHCSGRSQSRSDRVCFAIDYVCPSVRPEHGPDSALLVRGEDRYGYYEPEARPEADFSPAALRHFYRAAVQRDRRIIAVMRALRQVPPTPTPASQ